MFHKAPWLPLWPNGWCGCETNAALFRLSSIRISVGTGNNARKTWNSPTRRWQAARKAEYPTGNTTPKNPSAAANLYLLMLMHAHVMLQSQVHEVVWIERSTDLTGRTRRCRWALAGEPLVASRPAPLGPGTAEAAAPACSLATAVLAYFASRKALRAASPEGLCQSPTGVQPGVGSAQGGGGSGVVDRRERVQ